MAEGKDVAASPFGGPSNTGCCDVTGGDDVADPSFEGSLNGDCG